MSSLNEKFGKFATKLEEINTRITTEIAVSPGSALYGDVANKYVDLWADNYSTFGDFYKNFDKWSETVVAVSSLDKGFESDAAMLFNKHQSNSLEMTGISDARMRSALEMGATTLGGVALSETEGAEVEDVGDGRKVVTITLEDGTIYTYVENSEGRMMSLSGTDSNGVQIIQKEFAINGNVRTSKLNEDGTVSYEEYNSDGELVSTGTCDDNFVPNSFVITDGSGNSKTYTMDDSGNYIDETGAVVTDSNIINQLNDINKQYSDESLLTGQTVDTVEVDDSIKSNWTDAQQFVMNNPDINSAEWKENFAKLSSSEQEAVYEEYAASFLGENGWPDGSEAWQNKFNNLPSEVQDNIINEISGSYAEQGDDYSVSTDVPTSGEYDGRTIITPKYVYSSSDYSPYDDLDTNGQIIYDSTLKVQETIGNEITTITGYKDSLATNEAYNNLSAEQKAEVDSYLEYSILERQNVSSQIDDALKAPVFGNDGPIGELTSTYKYVSDNQDYQEKYDAAVAAANGINDSINNLGTTKEVESFLNGYGIFID